MTALALLLTGSSALADAAFLVTPTRLEFGEIHVGDTSPQQAVTVTNVSAAPLTVLATGGATRDPTFTAVQNCGAVTLAPGASCQFFHSFTPGAVGPVGDSAPLTLQGTPPSGGTPTPEQSFAIDVSGTGIAAGATPTLALLITPTRLDFGEVGIGATSPKQVVAVTNVSASPIAVQPGGGGTTIFDATQDCANVTLAPGASCHFFYSLTPRSLGPLAEESRGSINGQTLQVALQGVGVEAQAAALPFAVLNVLLAEARPPQQRFFVSASARLGAGSDGIDPTTEAVTLVAGQFSTTIPPGSFRRLANGTLTFTSPALTAAIRGFGRSRFTFAATVQGASPEVNPADVSLTIGNDGGNTVSVKPIVLGR